MNPLPLVPGLLCVFAMGAGTGALLRRLWCGREAPVVSSVALTGLAGMLALAALLPGLSLLALPRPVVLGIGALLAVAGGVDAIRTAKWRRPPAPTSVLLAMLAGAALASPFMLATTLPILAHDAILIWWPKVEEVARGAWPAVASTDLVHAHPEYPRGLAWLVTLASPLAAPDPRLVKAVPLLMTFLTALTMHATARWAGCRCLGSLVAVLFLLLPETASWAHSGLADLPVGAAVLVAGIGLSVRQRHRDGYALATAAAAGGAALKEEGAIVLLAVALALAADVFRRPGRRRPALAALGTLVVVLPWWIHRASGPSGILGLAGQLFEAPERLASRMAVVAQSVWLTLVDPNSLIVGGANVAWIGVPWVGWVVLAAMLVLVPRGPRPITVLPALLLIAADWAAYVMTSTPAPWHIRYSFDRLLLQVAPLLLLAAAVRGGRPEVPDGPAYDQ